MQFSQRKAQTQLTTKPPMIKGLAPAKINLALHVTGQREDGYHLLDSLVVFTEHGDHLSVQPSSDLTLTVTGLFAEGVPTDERNLVIKAARLLQRIRGVSLGAQITLDKCLPHPAGIGGGSSDAACTLKLLAELWQVEPLAPDHPAIVELGADVPVCMHAPNAVFMRGIGDEISEAPTLPKCAAVLVNPLADVPTPETFKRLAQKTNPPLTELTGGLTLEGFTSWLNEQRNDLYTAAAEIAPAIEEALTLMRRQKQQVLWANMSGSGATCTALCKDMGAARQVARLIQIQHQNWWVVPTPLLS